MPAKSDQHAYDHEYHLYLQAHQEDHLPPPDPNVQSTVERGNWTKRLSRTLTHRSGSLLAHLVPFRKNSTAGTTESEHDDQSRQRRERGRRASAVPQTVLPHNVLTAEHKERQRRRSADRIYALKTLQVGNFTPF
ncbi:hypothetical protein WR25_15524 [Diploscapter pachys]|uniref:Uncharacterized protein n=1 Tax=Diploscapter pachys TaxID=2018661 RepID=A0A2A2KPL8_9BILA|nr:hypothetical protein WR25_15524 [Diploscapter pachys]